MQPPASKAVLDALRGRSRGNLPRGELFLEAFIDTHYPHSSKEDYPNLLGQAARELGLALTGIDLNQTWSRSLLAKMAYRQLKDYFLLGFINGPVARFVEAYGFRDAMLNMRKKPAFFHETSKAFLEDVENLMEMAVNNGLSGIALADDIAGSSGLLFSPRLFHDLILPTYKAFAHIAKNKGLFAFLHSDGDMNLVINALIDAGFDCLHPVDVSAGQSLSALSAAYGKKLSFMGNIDLFAWDAVRISDEIDGAEKEFASGGLIMGSAGGIPVDIPHDRLCALYPKWARRGVTL